MFMFFRSICLSVAVLASGAVFADQRESDKEALTPLQQFVGGWRGVGQVARGSTRGSWIEHADWVWKFDKTRARLAMQTKDAKFFAAGSITALEDQRFRLTVTGADEQKLTVKYSGGLDESGKLILLADPPVAGQPDRISFRTVAKGKRLLVLYERKSPSSNRFFRMSEVGFTRKGSDFGKGLSYIECVVTGGEGTIPVTFEGKTYYVCCTGCRDYFNDDPAKALAEYRARKAKDSR